MLDQSKKKRKQQEIHFRTLQHLICIPHHVKSSQNKRKIIKYSKFSRGLVVEFTPVTGATRVRFPAREVIEKIKIILLLFLFLMSKHQAQMKGNRNNKSCGSCRSKVDHATADCMVPGSSPGRRIFFLHI